ncbi:hypothetical protein GA0115246_103782 [Streptomyces sp. SolWspMP-sol7th]|nr:hypothetical protein GA0115246_103782 [Streptomyces sp. SolWspMP-sol7th]
MGGGRRGGVPGTWGTGRAATRWATCATVGPGVPRVTDRRGGGRARRVAGTEGIRPITVRGMASTGAGVALSGGGSGGFPVGAGRGAHSSFVPLRTVWGGSPSRGAWPGSRHRAPGRPPEPAVTARLHTRLPHAPKHLSALALRIRRPPVTKRSPARVRRFRCGPPGRCGPQAERPPSARKGSAGMRAWRIPGSSWCEEGAVGWSWQGAGELVRAVAEGGAGRSYGGVGGTWYRDGTRLGTPGAWADRLGGGGNQSPRAGQRHVPG